MAKKITCPRRMTDWGPWERKEGLDTYRKGGGLVGQPRACSFCGSLPPDDFMNMARSGAELSPTDKPYKVYVENPSSGKFYFQHLSDEQKHEFLDLLNARRLNIGYPGHFYVLPYFIGTST